MLHRLLAAAALALACATPALAQKSSAAPDFQRYALSVSAVEKFAALNREMEKLPRPKGADTKDDDDDQKDGETVDDIVKKIDAQPAAKALLAKHGFSSRSYALTAMALFQAGFYLAMEPSMDKKKGAALLASYPKETQANIELLRKNPALLKK